MSFGDAVVEVVVVELELIIRKPKGIFKSGKDFHCCRCSQKAWKDKAFPHESQGATRPLLVPRFVARKSNRIQDRQKGCLGGASS